MELTDKAFDEMSTKLEAALRTAESFRQKSIDLEAENAKLREIVGAMKRVLEVVEYPVRWIVQTLRSHATVDIERESDLHKELAKAHEVIPQALAKYEEDGGRK